MSHAFTYNDAFEHEIRRRINSGIEETTRRATTPGFCPTMERYQFHLGTLEAFRDILKLCDEVHNVIYGRPNASD